MPRYWHALCDETRMRRIPFPLVACATLAVLALGACDSSYERVSATGPENLARNVSVGPPAASEGSAPASPDAPPVCPSRPAPESISDAVITAKVRASLLADESLRGSDISVSSDHGVVVLAGTVKSYEQVGIASAYAQRQDGVMRVDNQLTLLPQ